MKKSYLPQFIQSRIKNLDFSIFDPLIKEETQWLFLFELRRQGFHIIYGLGVCFLIFLLGDLVLLFFVIAIPIGLILSLLVLKGYKVPFITRMLNIFDRQEDIDVLPGKGAITFSTGAAITLFFFSNYVLVGILVLTISDSFSTLVGKKWGKHLWRKEETRGKTLEGSIGFFICTFIVIIIFCFNFAISHSDLLLTLFITLFVSIIATISELQSYIDDNLVIPFVVAGLLFLFNQLLIFA
ncbi:MAG: diacylglycerol/polyprenol kinase family protein [Promethearchaeota archaeon]